MPFRHIAIRYLLNTFSFEWTSRFFPTGFAAIQNKQNKLTQRRNIVLYCYFFSKYISKWAFFKIIECLIHWSIPHCLKVSSYAFWGLWLSPVLLWLHLFFFPHNLLYFFNDMFSSFQCFNGISYIEPYVCIIEYIFMYFFFSLIISVFCTELSLELIQ